MKLQEHGGRRPLFFFHGDLNGGGFYCRELARHLGPEQPVFAIHPLGLDDRPVPATIEAMATEHLARMRELQPRGPYFLGGYCNGGLMAYEVARRLPPPVNPWSRSCSSRRRLTCACAGRGRCWTSSPGVWA